MLEELLLLFLIQIKKIINSYNSISHIKSINLKKLA
jgi:hypothetical protein